MIKYILVKIESSINRTIVIALADIFFFISWRTLRLLPGYPRCPICGALLATVYRPVLSRLLAAQWNLNNEWANYFNRREGEICISCGGSIRARQMARTLTFWINKNCQTDSIDTHNTGLRSLPLKNIRNRRNKLLWCCP